jgi:hypothetical protein
MKNHKIFFSILNYCLLLMLADINVFSDQSYYVKASNVIFIDNIIITDYTIYQNETIILDGNITIENYGQLDIRDCRIIINTLSNGSCGIFVMAGGVLRIDHSNISSNTSFNYIFVLYNKSNCIISKSEIRNCGYDAGYDPISECLKHGIGTQSDNLTIQDSVIYYDQAGIFSNGSITILRNTNFIPNYSYQGIKTGFDGPLFTDLSGKARFIMDNCTIYGVLCNDSYEEGPLCRFGTGFTPDDPQASNIRNSVIIQAITIINSAMVTNSIIKGNFGHFDASLILSRSNVSFENCTIINTNTNGYGIDMSGGRFVAANCSINGGGTDIILREGWINLINCRLPSYEFASSDSILDLSSFLNLTVVGQDNTTPIIDANITIYDKLNNLIFKGITGTDGRISYIPILYKEIKSNYFIDMTPHRVVVDNGKKEITTPGINMSTNRDIRVIIDDTPPALAVTYPPDGLITNQTFIWVCGTTDVDAIITIDGGNIENKDGIFNVSYWLEEGNNTISVIAWDNAGNHVEIQRNVTCLIIPPSLQIIEPMEMDVVNQNPIIVKGKTNGTRLELDGNPVSVLKSGDFTYSWMIPNEGKRTLTARAWDIAGNSRIVKRSIIYDITPPAIEIVSPQNGSWSRYKSAEIQIRSPEATSLKIKGLTVDPDNTGFAKFEITLKEGENRISISAWDDAGNENATILVLYLDTNIFLEVTDPLGDILINYTEVTIRGKTEAGASVTVNGTPAENKGGNFELLLRLQEGKNKITVISIDKAGNDILRTFIIEVDTIPPMIEILSPTELTVKTQSIRIRIRTEACANVTINGYGAAVEGSDIFFFGVSLVEGDNSFKISATDNAGNTAVKDLSVAYVPPKPPITTDGGGELTLALLGLVVLVGLVVAGSIYYMRKRKGRLQGPI